MALKGAVANNLLSLNTDVFSSYVPQKKALNKIFKLTHSGLTVVVSFS